MNENSDISKSNKWHPAVTQPPHDSGSPVFLYKSALCPVMEEDATLREEAEASLLDYTAFSLIAIK